jgi:hypothetical protein
LLGGVEIFVEGQAGAELLARLPACRMVGSEFESLLALFARFFAEKVKKCLSVYCIFNWDSQD